MTAVGVLVTAADLQNYEFPELRFVVEGILPAGCILFAGAPKLGKSIWALQLGVNVARGDHAFGKIPVDAADVMVAVLEDGGLRRTQDRLQTMLGDDPWPARLHLTDAMDRLDEGGIQWLNDWLDAHDQAGLIVIDTLKRVRPMGKGGMRRHYDEDYDALAALTDLANSRNVSILVVHHTREMASDDWIDSISGSRGLTASVDTILAATRGRSASQAVLKIVGRDIPEAEWAFEIDFDRLTWTLQGDAALFVLSEARLSVLELFDDFKTITAGTLKDELNMTAANARKTLSRMAKDSQIAKLEAGLYGPLPSQNRSHTVTQSHMSPEGRDSVTGVTGFQGGSDELPVPI